MKIARFIVSSSRIPIMSSLVLSLIVACASVGNASDQKESDQKERVVRTDGSTVEIKEFTYIPEATEPCSSEEFEWWKQVRKAGNDLLNSYAKGNKKLILEARAKFFLLLYEGQQKAHRVPLKDRPPQTLITGRTSYPASARQNKIEGAVVVLVEFKSDGLVGDSLFIKRLGYGLDENVIEAAHKAVFVPAIKDGAFVTHWSKVEFSFDLPGGSYPNLKK